DNPMNMVLIHDLLAIDGHEVIEAVDGREAIELAIRSQPDLVITDIQMPYMDGYEIIKALKENPATLGIAIVVTTSFAMIGDREKAMAAGAIGYISKPIDTRQFRILVSKILEEIA
ncbi:MAG: response regulator, partial [Spirochaetota bacterium]